MLKIVKVFCLGVLFSTITTSVYASSEEDLSVSSGIPTGLTLRMSVNPQTGEVLNTRLLLPNSENSSVILNAPSTEENNELSGNIGISTSLEDSNPISTEGLTSSGFVPEEEFVEPITIGETSLPSIFQKAASYINDLDRSSPDHAEQLVINALYRNGDIDKEFILRQREFTPEMCDEAISKIHKDWINNGCLTPTFVKLWFEAYHIHRTDAQTKKIKRYVNLLVKIVSGENVNIVSSGESDGKNSFLTGQLAALAKICNLVIPQVNGEEFGKVILQDSNAKVISVLLKLSKVKKKVKEEVKQNEKKFKKEGKKLKKTIKQFQNIF